MNELVSDEKVTRDAYASKKRPGNLPLIQYDTPLNTSSLIHKNNMRVLNHFILHDDLLIVCLCLEILMLFDRLLLLAFCSSSDRRDLNCSDRLDLNIKPVSFNDISSA